MTDLFRDEESGALFVGVFRELVGRAIFEQDRWSLALVELRSSPQFFDVAHGTHAEAMRAAVVVLESAAPTGALVGRTGRLEFAVLAPGKPRLLKRMMADAAGDLDLDGVTYTVDWIVRGLSLSKREPAANRAATHSTPHAMPWWPKLPAPVDREPRQRRIDVSITKALTESEHHAQAVASRPPS